MIYKEKAYDIIDAAQSVTLHLLENTVPSQTIIIKPNIVQLSPPPVTTDVRVVEGIVKALREYDIRDIMIAEGSGLGETMSNFNSLGFGRLGVRLVDLDKERTVTLRVANFHVWDELIVPEILLNTFIISVPVLKEHSMCDVTISLKNMVGILPERDYSGYWTFKKSQIHRHNPDGCIADIVSLIRPDWAIVDATVGMRGSHLGGTLITPPLNLIYGSTDPLEADIYGCSLLGKNWKEVEHLRLIAKGLRRTDQKTQVQ
jgi:uncharacterized protein (DUF362 family)